MRVVLWLALLLLTSIDAEAGAAGSGSCPLVDGAARLGEDGATRLTRVTSSALLPFDAAHPDLPADIAIGIKKAKTRLLKHSYTVAGCREALQLGEFDGFHPNLFSDVEQGQHYASKLPPVGSSPLADLIRVFLMRAPLPLPRLVALLGKKSVSALQQLGVLAETSAPGAFHAAVQLIPISEDLVLATDYFQTPRVTGDGPGALEPVMYLGLDSRGGRHSNFTLQRT